MKKALVVALAALASATVFGQNGTGPNENALMGQARRPTPRIYERIDDGHTVKLTGNTLPMARAEFDKGSAPSNLQLAHMLLVLKRSPEQEASLQQLIHSQHQAASSSFHQWLTPGDFGAQFGAAQEDVDKITAWLKSHGFTVEDVGNSRTSIQFSGTSLLVRRAFHTDIHMYEVQGQRHFANSSDPEIPAALAPVVSGISSLHNFQKRPSSHLIRALSDRSSSGISSEYTAYWGHAVTPGDFWTIYNATPAIRAGTTGRGVTIGIAGRSDVYAADISAFRSSYLGGPSFTGTFQPIVNGPDPGFVSGDDVENTLDVEWASALAPDANVKLVISASGASDGVDLSARYLVNNNAADVISISYGLCESFLGASENQFLSGLFAQATAQGITVVVASGDNGSAGCDVPGATANASNPTAARYGMEINGLASTPYNVAVGGTQYYNESTSWSAGNSNDPLPGTSALGYIPERVWNESCSPGECAGRASLWAAGGGASNCALSNLPYYDVTGCSSGWPKPEWQADVWGIPDDGVRDVPDVSFTAASHDGYMVDFESGVWLVGGTSASTPSFAGVMALVNQKLGGRQGQANYVLYQLAGVQYGGPNTANSSNLLACNADSQSGSANSCTFYDITTGNNAVPCAGGTPNCSASEQGSYGALPGVGASAGYDLASGIGSINISNLIAAWDALVPRGASPTVTTLQVSPTTIAVHGSPVLMSGSVMPKSGVGNVTGTVSIVANNNVIDTVAVNGGTFSGTVRNLPGGQYTVFARYSGNANYAASTSQGVIVSVGKESSVTTVSVTARRAQDGASLPANAIPYGSNIILHASVAAPSGQGVPTGQLQFSNGVNVPLDSGGAAAFGNVYIAPGSYTSSATYAGDSSFNVSTSSNSSAFTVCKADTTLAITAGFPSGGKVPMTATVSANSYGVVPSGNVVFFVNGNVVGSAVLRSSGSATMLAYSNTTFTLTGTMLSAGASTVTASYAGDQNYNSSNASSPVTVAASKATVTAPAVPVVPVLAEVFRPGTQIPISALIYGAFQNLRVEWAAGLNATSGWSSANVTINRNVSAPVTNQEVATWMPSGIASGGYYTIRLSVDDGGITSSATSTVYVEPDLASGDWPMWFDGSLGSYSGFVPVVLPSGATGLTLATNANSTSPGYLRNFGADGSYWQMAIPVGPAYQPTAGDLDRNSGDEIVVPNGASLSVARADGSSYLMTPTIPGINLFFGRQQVLLDDVDGDSLLETVALGDAVDSALTETGTTYLFAWRNNGELLNRNFPVAIRNQNSTMANFGAPRVLVGDIDGDGSKEFVVLEGTSPASFTPILFSADGSPRVWGAPTINSYPDQMLLADLDHNGKLETIIFSEDRFLHVLQPDGSERAGWPQHVTYSGLGSSLAVGDLNRDGREEIVLSEMDLHVFNADGTEYSSAWPKTPTVGGYGPAILADVNGDGFPEIVTNFSVAQGTGANSYLQVQLVVLDRYGNQLKSWSMMGANGEVPHAGWMQPVVGDFNNDGQTDIAVSYPLYPVGGGGMQQSAAMIFTTGAPYNPTANDWPMLYQNSHNTAVLRRVAKSMVALTSVANPCLAGNPEFTVTVSATSGSGVPGGIANLLEGATNLGSCRLISGTCTIRPMLRGGSHLLVAGYVGDKQFAPGMSGVLSQAVSLLTTSTSASASPDSITMGGTTNLTATVSSSDTGSITGTVMFTAGVVVLGTAPVASGIATLSNVPVTLTNGFMVGVNAITAAYSGDGNFGPSSGSTNFRVLIPSPTQNTLLAQVSAGSDGEVWGRDDRDNIYRFDSGPGTWKQMPGALSSISVGSSAHVWGLNSAGAIYRFNSSAQGWDWIPGSLAQIAVGRDGDVWGLNSGHQIWHFDAINQRWRNVSGLLTQIAVGSQGAVWGINSSGSIYRFNIGTQTFEQVSGQLSQIAVGADGDVWGINSQSLIWHFNTLVQNWEHVPGSLAQISVGSGANVWGINGAGILCHFNAQSGSWSWAAGSIMQVSAGANGATWGVSTSNNVQQLSGEVQQSESWHNVPGSLSKLTSGPDGNTWGLNSAGQIWHFNHLRQSWEQIPGLLSKIGVGFGGSVWGVDPVGLIYRYNAATQSWQNVPGSLAEMSVGARGEVWGINSAGLIYRYNTAIQGWENIPGSLSQIEVGANGDVWGINCVGSIYRFIAETHGWQWIPGYLTQLSVGKNGELWGINAANQIWRFNPATAGWDSIPGALSQIAVSSSTTVWGVNSAGAIWRFNANTQGWDNVAGSLAQISIAYDGTVWGIDGANQIYHFEARSR